jgi:hypothetical protein
MNKKYLLIGAIGLIAVYFIYKKFVAKNESPLDVKNLGKREKTESDVITPLALKPRPTLANSPFGNIIAENTRPEFNETETALGLENKYNNAYC